MTVTNARSLRTRFSEFVEDMRTLLHNSREFSGHGIPETERLLRDVSLSMSDMASLTKPHSGPSVLLPKRLDLVGIDVRYLEQADPATLKELQDSCRDCANWRTCARDLARGDAQSGLDRYCLNASLIDSFVLDRHDRNTPS